MKKKKYYGKMQQAMFFRKLQLKDDVPKAQLLHYAKTSMKTK
jgi:hypothetical protein